MTKSVLLSIVALTMTGYDAKAQTPYLKAKSSAATGGPTLLQLAQQVTDATSGVTVAGSVTSAINVGGGSPSDSDAHSLGKFWDGNVPSGTDLPTPFQPNQSSPSLQYAGGIGEILSIVVDEEFQAAASLGLIPSMN